jgi:UDP-2-acetamido-3-amino-2,3-dideoxy-glucuronate N-acetyltransferase
MVGNPAKQIGWVSEFGHRLHFNHENLAVCPESNQNYKLDKEHVFKI